MSEVTPENQKLLDDFQREAFAMVKRYWPECGAGNDSSTADRFSIEAVERLTCYVIAFAAVGNLRAKAPTQIEALKDDPRLALSFTKETIEAMMPSVMAYMFEYYLAEVQKGASTHHAH